MTNDERTKRLNELLIESMQKKYCKTKKEFSQMVGYGYTTISAALHGSEKYLSDKMISECEYAVRQKDMENAVNVQTNDSSIEQKKLAPAEADASINEIVDKFLAELAAQRESHERIMMAMIGAKNGQK